MKKHAINAREALMNRLNPNDAVLLFSGKSPHKSLDQDYPYTPQRNFFYLTNLSEPNLILFMLKGEDKEKTYLFVEENTKHIIQWEGARITKSEASERSGIPEANIFYTKQFENLFNQTMNYARSVMGTPPEKLYLDLYHPDFNRKPQGLLHSESLIERYPELELANVNKHLSYLRMFKSDEELAMIKKAIDHTRKGLERILKNMQKRDMEYQLQADFLHEITLSGSEGNAFDTIAACGANATVLHYVDNKDALSKDKLILFDLGALHGNYASDISRTYPVGGTFTKRQRELYDIVLKVNKETIKQVRPGQTWKGLNAFAREMLAKEAVKAGVIENEEAIKEVYYHSIGHFMGLDVHDVGHYDQPFEKGMVLTIEPGLYVKDEGIGIRIEDDVLVTEDGYENLSESIPKEADEIEQLI
ncbi:MAG: aminopeptidase P N-terminal domain-containing protein [Bacillota bacterium]